MNPVHNFPTYFIKIYSNIIFPSTPRSSEWSLPFISSDQNFVIISHLSHACYIPRSSHSSWLDYSNNIWWWVQVMKLLIRHSSSAFLLGRNTLLSTQFSDTLSVRDQVSLPCKWTGKTVVLYILNFKFLDRRQEDSMAASIPRI